GLQWPTKTPMAPPSVRSVESHWRALPPSHPLHRPPPPLPLMLAASSAPRVEQSARQERLSARTAAVCSAVHPLPLQLLPMPHPHRQQHPRPSPRPSQPCPH